MKHIYMLKTRNMMISIESWSRSLVIWKSKNIIW